jgi:hypothetical protein
MGEDAADGFFYVPTRELSLGACVESFSICTIFVGLGALPVDSPGVAFALDERRWQKTGVWTRRFDWLRSTTLCIGWDP